MLTEPGNCVECGAGLKVKGCAYLGKQVFRKRCFLWGVLSLVLGVGVWYVVPEIRVGDRPLSWLVWEAESRFWDGDFIDETIADENEMERMSRGIGLRIVGPREGAAGDRIRLGIVAEAYCWLREDKVMRVEQRCVGIRVGEKKMSGMGMEKVWKGRHGEIFGFDGNGIDLYRDKISRNISLVGVVVSEHDVVFDFELKAYGPSGEVVYAWEDSYEHQINVVAGEVVCCAEEKGEFLSAGFEAGFWADVYFDNEKFVLDLYYSNPWGDWRERDDDKKEEERRKDGLVQAAYGGV